MKLLLLTWDYPPVCGGIQIWMFELARRLPRGSVTVYAPAVSGGEVFDAVSGVPVRRLRIGRAGQTAWSVRLAAAILAACWRTRVDLIVCGHVATAPVALLMSRLFGIPYVVFTYAYEIRRKGKRRLVGLLLRRATRVIAISRFTAAAVLKHGVVAERVCILHPGADPERFRPHHTAGRSEIEPGSRVLLSVSRLSDRYKGHDTVIRALPLIKAKCPDVRYLIAGDGPLRAYLSRLAQSLGVEQYVEFLGEVPDAVLPDLYRGCDLFIQMSRESGSGGGAEGFGIVCLEAAATGKPVVAGRSGGLVDAVADGHTGLLVDSNDLGAVAEAVVALLLDPALAHRMGQAGRARVLQGFTWDQMAANAQHLFAEVTGRA